jgi:hypothetical protein
MERVEKYFIVNNNISSEDVNRVDSGQVVYVKYASLYSVNHNCVNDVAFDNLLLTVSILIQ